MTNAIIVVCTRPESKRLPRKPFIEIAGRRAIEHIVARLRPTDLPIVLAVPNGCGEYDYLRGGPVTIWQGNAESPLHRMSSLLAHWAVDYVVRVTHDDILVDAQELLELLEKVDAQKAGYGYSPGIIEGAGVEVISRANILAAAKKVTVPVEHISYFVKGIEPNPIIVVHEPRASICRPYCMTMDYPEDALALELVLRRLGPDATVESICDFLDLHPQILRINRRPLVSVYTCVKNGERFLQQAMESVLMSQFEDMEYIVVDDGSTDNTPLIAAKFVRNRLVPVKLLLNEKNLGLASSSNRAIATARGKYVLRMDADDVLFPDALGHLVNKIESENADIVYPDYRELREDGDQPYRAASLNHHAGCAIMRRSFINALWFKEGLKWWDSLELHTRASKIGEIGYLNAPAFLYRRHDKNITVTDPVGRQEAARSLGLTTTASPPGIDPSCFTTTTGIPHVIGTHVIERGCEDFPNGWEAGI